MDQSLKELIQKTHACREGIEWLKETNIKTLEEAWSKCPRGDWMLCIAVRLQLPLTVLTKAKVECAKLVEHLMEDERSINALRVAERFSKGEATREELDNAARHARSASYAARSASYAVDAAAYAAAAASASAVDAAIDSAGYSAGYSAYSAAVAVARAAIDSADDFYNHRAKQNTQQQCADICRKYITVEMLEKEG